MIRRLTFGPLASESKEPRDASELRSCQLPSIGRPRRWRPRTLYLLPTGARVPPPPPHADPAVVWRRGRTGALAIISPLWRFCTPPLEYG